MKARGAIRIPVAEGDESSQASIRMCSYRFKKALSDISLDKPERQQLATILDILKPSGE